MWSVVAIQDVTKNYFSILSQQEPATKRQKPGEARLFSARSESLVFKSLPGLNDLALNFISCLLAFDPELFVPFFHSARPFQRFSLWSLQVGFSLCRYQGTDLSVP
jgi:hypothetical protein